MIAAMEPSFQIDSENLEPLPPPGLPFPEIRSAQQAWSQVSMANRLRILRSARHGMVSAARELAATVPLDIPGSLHRTVADTLVAEVLPLIEACRFLEREAGTILSPRRASNRSRPFWLRGVAIETRRDPYGIVLIIAPGNYPLFLAGAQALQALAAGNAVLWKPAPSGAAAAVALQKILFGAGLEPMLLQVLEESTDAATTAIRTGVDKVILTGSAETGRAVLRDLAETATPAVMELSGCDAVFVLEGADLDRVAAATAFGLRLNGSATCMAPRRLFASPDTSKLLRAKLIPLLEFIRPVTLTRRTGKALQELISAAESNGATVLCGGLAGDTIRPILIAGATPNMPLAQADVAAPVLCIIEVGQPDKNHQSALAAYRVCPYSLTAAVFGPEHEATRVAKLIPAGLVLVNDIIVSTADPRASFGGRGASGFGVTRGREGLLEMTTVKTVLTQRSRELRPYQPTSSGHQEVFLAYLRTAHGATLRDRCSGLLQLGKSLMRLNKPVADPHDRGSD